MPHRASSGAKGRFFQTLAYSSVNEDWRTEAEALRVGPGHRALVVTGSGDRPLDILALGPGRVVAVDLNPIQGALLRLKSAALAELPFAEYAAFLGLEPASGRWRRERLAVLLPRLEPEAAAPWSSAAGRRAVARGILYQGRWERFFGRGARLARLLRPFALPRLLAFGDLAAQRAFVQHTWDTPLWRLVYRLVLSGPALRFLLRDPAFYRGVAVPVGPYVYQRMLGSLERVLARDNFMVGLTLQGRLPRGDLPPYLTARGCEVIRPRLGALEVVTGDLVEYLERALPAGSFDRFSLSDVPSYLDQAGFERLLDGVARCAAPGARFCIRLFLTRPTFPARLAGRLVREPELERRLAEDDHAFAYEFIAGHVA